MSRWAWLICVIAFLDFKKAYDTVRRSFLVTLMRSFGAGEGLIKWFATLLSDTFTSASVNEHLSRLVEMLGGTPQGAGQSCGGYLFIPWALDCWLRKCLAVGVKVVEGAEDLRGWYYADDGHIVLKSLDPDVIAAFKEAMHVFALATNQHLNLGKTKLLPLGDWPAGSIPSSPSTALRWFRRSPPLASPSPMTMSRPPLTGLASQRVLRVSANVSPTSTCPPLGGHLLLERTAPPLSSMPLSSLPLPPLTSLRPVPR